MFYHEKFKSITGLHNVVCIKNRLKINITKLSYSNLNI